MISLRSKITKELLSYYFLHEDSKLYLNELAEKFNLDKRNLLKKLKELQQEGLFIKSEAGNLTYYKLNKDYPLYNEYKKIILKTAGIEIELRKQLKKLPGIEKAYIFGSYAENSMDASSDIDLLVVGSENIKSVNSVIIEFQKRIDREINLVAMTNDEYESRKAGSDRFLAGVIENNTRII